MRKKNQLVNVSKSASTKATEQALERIDLLERTVREKVRELYPEVRPGRRMRFTEWDGYVLRENLTAP